MITINYQAFGNRVFQLRLRLNQNGETRFINVTKMLKGAVQKKHWNIGLMNAHNSNPMIEPIRIAIHLATLFMPCSARFQLRASKASLVDGTAINWSVDSAPVKTNHNIFFA